MHKEGSFGVRACGKCSETELVWGGRSGLLTKEGGRAFPLWATERPLCLPPCPGPPALIPPCFLTACDPVGGLRGEPMGWGRWTRTVRSALRVEGSHPASHECGPRHVPDLGHQPLHLSSAKGPLHHAIERCELIPLPCPG